MTDCMHVRLVLEKCELRIGCCLALQSLQLPPRSSQLRITSQRQAGDWAAPPSKDGLANHHWRHWRCEAGLLKWGVLFLRNVADSLLCYIVHGDLAQLEQALFIQSA